MADINVERKERSIWPWILGLLALLLLIWLLVELFDRDRGDVAVAPVADTAAMVTPAAPPPPVPVAQGPGTIADILGNPAGFYGQPYATPQAVRVTEVPSDRGFWVEDQGQRLFVVLNESPQSGTADVQGKMAEKPDINVGDMVQITEGTLQDPTNLQNVAGPLDAQTRQILSGQRVFLNTQASNVRKM